MKNIVVVSTYPEHGSKNIGDWLITQCLSNIIHKINQANVDIVWRADDWLNVKNKILKADHVFFACLAIRPQMHKKQYPFLENVIESNVPFSVIAAGTELPVTNKRDLFGGFSKKTLELLTRVNDYATVFTTRGWGTQEFCERQGLTKAVFNGDVAFFDERNKDLKFLEGQKIKNIYISDPHRPTAYRSSLNLLYDNIATIFPESTICITQHGTSTEIDNFCQQKNIECIKIYENKFNGLDIYKKADLHVGYRVHGHVCTLKNRNYSYLLEQDGRGFDYGITLDKKISVPNYAYFRPYFSIKNTVKFILRKQLDINHYASSVPADEMLALIKKDYHTNFSKFVGLEDQIEKFNEQTFLSVKKALSTT